SILLGNGDGSFKLPVNYNVPAPATVAAADINADGKLDLVVGTLNRTLYMLPGNGDGTFQLAISAATDTDSRYIAIGDFNKDGKPDVAAIDPTRGPATLLPGTGSFSLPNRNRYLLGSSVGPIYALDFDWDGNLDIVIASGHPDALVPSIDTNVVAVLFGAGDG